MSTIPQRTETFKKVFECVVNRQTMPLDRLVVYLSGYDAVDPSLPSDPRVEYRLDSQRRGPWIRYLTADELQDDDVLVTLDDDTFYPGNYVERGLEAFASHGRRHVVSFGGIVWDPLSEPHTYMENRWHFLADAIQDAPQRVAFHMGLVSFFPARAVKGAVAMLLPGFDTNDDMMIAFAMQQRGLSIISVPRPQAWIRDLETAHANHALFKRDVETRYRTFREMVDTLRFDPTAGRLKEMVARPVRILVQADTCPPLDGTEALDAALRSLCNEESSVHVIAPVPRSRTTWVMHRWNAPYYVHAVSVPERGGRLDNVAPVRAWRNWRVASEAQRSWTSRLALARARLMPTRQFRFDAGVLLPV